MTKNNSENFSDHQLDELIRKVRVPEGLHDELSEIAFQTESNNRVIQKKPRFNRFLSSLASRPVVLAASIAALVLINVGIYVVFKIGTGDVPLAGKDDTTGIEKSSLEVGGAKPGNFKNETQRIQARMADLDAEMETLLANLNHERQKEFLNTKAQISERSELDVLEVRSLISAVAQHSQVSFGARREAAIRDLATVVDQYPGSVGSDYAKKIIDQLNQSH